MAMTDVRTRDLRCWSHAAAVDANSLESGAAARYKWTLSVTDRRIEPPMKKTWLQALLLLGAAMQCAPSLAGGGPLGIDHQLNYDNSGIWKRGNQLALQNVLIAGEVVGAIWEGGESRFGRTCWQSIDSTVLSGVSAQVLKLAFSRSRPSEGNDPNDFFAGHGHESFPSGEVTLVSSVVTPFVLEYGSDHPAVYALELLPVYDAIARMKVQAHWQTDVLAGFLIGTAAGYFAHAHGSPVILGVLPHGFTVGLRHEF